MTDLFRTMAISGRWRDIKVEVGAAPNADDGVSVGACPLKYLTWRLAFLSA